MRRVMTFCVMVNGKFQSQITQFVTSEKTFMGVGDFSLVNNLH